MENSKQIVQVTKSLTTAAECREDTKMLMQPHANWEEYLTPAPMSIGILAELIFISSGTDFSIREGGPEGGFQYIRYPDSFRACLMQVCNSGWRAFNDAHKNMDQIRLYTGSVPNYIKVAVQIILQDDDALVQAVLPDQLDNIRNIADECLKLAESTEKRFTDVIELIQELLETCISAKLVYGNKLDDTRKKIEESKLKKKASEEANKRAEDAFNELRETMKDAQEEFKISMDSMPSGWDMLQMNFVEGLANSVSTLITAVASMATTKVAASPTVIGTTIETTVQNENNDPMSANNIYSKACYILSLVEALNILFDGGHIKWSEITDQKTRVPKTNWTKEQFVRIQKAIEKENPCEPKDEALALCTNAITICSELEKLAPETERDEAKTQKIVELMKSLMEKTISFDTKSKNATHAPAFFGRPPQLSKTQENSSGSQSAAQVASNSARFRIEQSRAQLSEVRKLYQKCADNMENNKKEMIEIYATLKNCEVKEIDFSTTIKVLAQGLEAMGNMKEQWQKLIRFFQMVSNLMKTTVSTSLKEFAKKAKNASDKTLTYSSAMFLKDMMYSQAFHASNIASLVNMIATTYVEVSDKYLMDGVSRLSKLMSLDVSQPEFLNERRLMVNSCSDAEEGIRNLVMKNKEDFERKTKQRLEKIESGLKAVLPPVSEEKEREIREAVESASNQDADQYI